MQLRKKPETGCALHYTAPNIAVRYNQKEDLKSTFIPHKENIKPHT